MISESLRSQLAPTGKLRVGINYGNPVLARRDATSGELFGVAVDLARELGRRTELPIEIVAFDSAGKMFDAVKAGAWDVAFLAVDPGRADEIDFTAPYVEIEGTYLVPAGAPFQNVSDVDRAGVRVGVSGKSAYDLFLSRELKHAEIIRAQSPGGALELILSGKVDVLAGVRQTLMLQSAKLSGSHVFADRFMAIGQAMGVVKGRGEAVSCLREFVEDMKGSGFVARSLDKSGVTGVSIPGSAS
jgi:polar amino acid transport system substrate-binding protein